MTSLYANLVRSPGKVFRDLDGSLTEWVQSISLLVGIILINVALKVAVDSDELSESLTQSLRSGILFSLVLSISLLMALRLVVRESVSWTKAYTASVITMLPLVFGPLPFVGPAAILISVLLVYIAVKDIGGLTRVRAFGLSVLVWLLIITFGVIYTAVI